MKLSKLCNKAFILYIQYKKLRFRNKCHSDPDYISIGLDFRYIHGSAGEYMVVVGGGGGNSVNPHNFLKQASGQIFKDDENGMSSTADICFLM
jgi:hypothetical protein